MIISLGTQIHPSLSALSHSDTPQKLVPNLIVSNSIIKHLQPLKKFAPFIHNKSKSNIYDSSYGINVNDSDLNVIKQFSLEGGEMNMNRQDSLFDYQYLPPALRPINKPSLILIDVSINSKAKNNRPNLQQTEAKIFNN